MPATKTPVGAAMSWTDRGHGQRAATRSVQLARAHLDEGVVPAFLAEAHPAYRGRRLLGLAFVPVGGEPGGAGSHQRAFSLQSITKLFALALALAMDGDDVWQAVSYSAADGPFDSLKLDPETRPNPFANAGALIITDRLHTATGAAAEAVRECVAQLSGNPALRMDEAVHAAEMGSNQRNRALVHQLAALGVLRNPPTLVLEQYTAQCAIAASCADTARAAGFLAGMSGTSLLGHDIRPTEVRRINGLLSLAGTYNASAETMYRIGLPSKSGIGGGILTVAPGQGTVCGSAPGLDAHGNSIAARVAIERFFEHAAGLDPVGPASPQGEAYDPTTTTSSNCFVSQRSSMADR